MKGREINQFLVIYFLRRVSQRHPSCGRIKNPQFAGRFLRASSVKVQFTAFENCEKQPQLLTNPASLPPLSCAMADSLSAECTPLKEKYDTCFNAWFEGYLEPAVAASSSERAAHSKKKADEFQAKCGKVWEQYRECIQVRP